MKNNFYFGIIINIITGAIGFILHNFIGGLMVGFSSLVLFLSTYGKFVAKKTICKINKQIQDRLLPIKTNLEGN